MDAGGRIRFEELANLAVAAGLHFDVFGGDDDVKLVGEGGTDRGDVVSETDDSGGVGYGCEAWLIGGDGDLDVY